MPPDEDERRTLEFLHLSAFLTIVPTMVGPLLVWFMKREELERIDAEGRDAINFFASVMIYQLLCIPLVVVIVGAVGVVLLEIFLIVNVLRAATNAKKGTPYRFRFKIRMLR